MPKPATYFAPHQPMTRPFTVARSLAAHEARDIAQGVLTFEVHDIDAHLHGLRGMPLQEPLLTAAKDAFHSLDRLRAALQVIAKG